ncbi:MAG: tetratricopeptide repeat protein [Candidatus Marinimicrobia bacterium]|nr:tetratricopeptide repeat protein [Candidatus Neomarinimicrobiota bacterium]
MRIKFFHWITRLLFLSFLAGVLPINSAANQVVAQEQEKKKSSKKKSKKKQPSKKKKRSKKKKPSKKKRSGKSKRTAPKKVAATPVPKKEVSVIHLTGELFEYTNKMKTSSQRLAHATRYLATPQTKEVVRIESKPKYTTRDYEAAAQKAPFDIRAQRQLGMHYEQSQDWENAKDVYLRVLTKNPLNPDAHFYLGNMYQNMGDDKKARDSYEEALALDPSHRATLDILATGSGASDNNAVLEQSAATHPDGPAQKLTLIKQKINSGDHEDAIKLAVLAQDQFPEHGGFVFLQGRAYEELGEINKAKSSYQRAIKMDPRNEDAHLSLGHLYFNQGKYVYAALAFSDVVYLNNYDVDARYMQGLSYFNANEWGRAASAWEDLLHYSPQHPLVKTLLPQAYYILAVEYNRMGESTLGRTSFSKALSVNNHSRSWLPGAMRSLGKYYREKGMYKESLSAYQEVVELKPMDAEAYTGMGITYWKMKEQQLAKAAWQRSLELNPDSNEARGWLMIAHQG